MEKTKKNAQKIILICGIIALIIGLLISIGFNVFQGICYIKCDSYLQDPEEIYVMEAGILNNNLEFHDGTDYEFKYDFSHENYKELKSKYNLENTAKDGTEFERALRLMDEYAPRLTHKSDYKNDIAQSSLELLEYSLNDKNHGINCRAAEKANDYIEFYWLNNSDDCDYFYNLLDEKHTDYNSLVQINNDEKFGNIVYCGTENAVNDAGIKVVVVKI